MATNGSVTTSSNGGRSIRFSWGRTSYSINNNTSTLQWELRSIGGSAGSYVKGGPFTVKIDNGVIHQYTGRMSLYPDTLIAAGTITLTHDGSGNKTFSVYVDGAIYSTSVNVSGSGSFTLDSLPRGADLNTFTDGTYMDKQCNITYTPKANGFYYRLRISIPNVLAIKYINLGSQSIGLKSYNYTLTTSDITKIVNSSAITNTVASTLIGCVIETHSNSSYTSKISESSELVRTQQLPLTYKPSFTSVTQTINGDYNNQILKGINTVSYSIIDGTTSDAKATIKSYNMSSSIGLSGSNTSGVFNTGTINTSGTITFYFSITDSRGRTSDVVSKVISVINYNRPIINLTAYRSLNDGSRDDSNGTYISTVVTFSVHSGTTVKSRFIRIAGVSKSTSFISGTKYIYGTYDKNEQYIVEASITDNYNITSYVSYTVNKAIVLIHVPTDKTGIGLGMLNSRIGYLEIGYKCRIYDIFVSEHQSRGSWASGTGAFHMYVNRSNSQNMFMTAVDDSSYLLRYSIELFNNAAIDSEQMWIRSGKSILKLSSKAVRPVWYNGSTDTSLARLVDVPVLIRTGSVVISFSNTLYSVMFTASQINSMLGVTSYDTTKITIAVSSGDLGSYNRSLGSAISNTSKNAFATVPLEHTGLIRVNYAVIYKLT